MSGRTSDGGPVRILNVVDEYTRVALGSRVARSIGARDVINELERLFKHHGKPQLLRSDNGREFIADESSDVLRAARLLPLDDVSRRRSAAQQPLLRVGDARWHNRAHPIARARQRRLRWQVSS